MSDPIVIEVCNESLIRHVEDALNALAMIAPVIQCERCGGTGKEPTSLDNDCYACLGDGGFTSMQAIQMAALAQHVLNDLNECVASSSTEETEDNTMLESLIADVAALQASTEQFNANYGITLVWCGLEGFESELRAVDAMPDDTPEAKVRKAKEVNRLRNWFNDSKQHIESARVRDLQLRLNAGRAIYGLLTELWESITDHLDPDNINALLGTDLCNRINAAITGKLPTP